jgi:hypothetical protein
MLLVRGRVESKRAGPRGGYFIVKKQWAGVECAALLQRLACVGASTADLGAANETSGDRKANLSGAVDWPTSHFESKNHYGPLCHHGHTEQRPAHKTPPQSIPPCGLC